MTFLRKRLLLVSVVCIHCVCFFYFLCKFEVPIGALFARPSEESPENVTGTSGKENIPSIPLLVRSKLSNNLSAKTRILLFTYSVQLNELPNMSCDVYQVPKNIIRDLRQKRRVKTPTLVGKGEDPITAALQRTRSIMRQHGVIIFHVFDMPLLGNLQKLSRSREPHQKFVIYTKESPYNVPGLSRKGHDGIFDWVVTYKTDADVFAPYGRYTKLARNTPVNNSWLFPGVRAKRAVWIVSHCGELRDEYARKLRRHIPIDVFGSCSKFFGQPGAVCVRSSEQCEDTLKTYRFSLAFENSFCIDYVTEKYWDALRRGSIPVVLGGSDYSERIAIPGSFINARDFNSSENLAKHLQALESNHVEYMKYHTWRSEYELDYDAKDRQRLEYVLQGLCDLATKESRNNSKYKLSKYYSVEGDCKLQLILQKHPYLVW